MNSKEIRIVTLTSLAHFLNDGTSLVFPLLIVYYTTIYHVSIVYLGLLSVIYTLLSGLLSPPIGNFADKHNIDALLLSLGIFIEAISFLLFALSFAYPSSIYVLTAIATVILGIGQAFYHPIGGAILSRSFKQSGRILGINGSLGSLGRALTPSIVTVLLLAIGEVLGLLTVFAYMAIASLIIFLGLSFYKKDVVTEVRKKEEKLEKKYYKFLIILGIIVFLRAMFITGTTTFVSKFLYDVYLSKVFVGIFLTITFIGSVIGQPFFGWLTEKIGGKRAYDISGILSIISFLIFILFPKNVILATSMYFIFTFAAYTAFPVLLGYVAQTFPRSFYTVANSYVWGIGNVVGGAVGNAVITALLGLNFTLLDSFYVMLVIAIISVAMSPLIPKVKVS